MKVSETEMKISGRNFAILKVRGREVSRTKVTEVTDWSDARIKVIRILQRMKATDRKVARMKVTDRKVARMKGADRKVERMKVTDRKVARMKVTDKGTLQKLL